MNSSKKKFIDRIIKNIPQILTKKIIADVETPISLLLKLIKSKIFLFLESVEGGSKKEDIHYVDVIQI